jgi:hypothetical protein
VPVHSPATIFGSQVLRSASDAWASIARAAALGQQRAQRPGEVGRTPHFLDRHTEQERQTLPAILGRRGNARPATGLVLAVGGLEFLGNEDAAILDPAALPVADDVGWGDDAAGKLGGLFEDCLGKIRRRFFTARQSGDPVQAGKLADHKQHFADWTVIFRHRFPAL